MRGKTKTTAKRQHFDKNSPGIEQNTKKNTNINYKQYNKHIYDSNNYILQFTIAFL